MGLQCKPQGEMRSRFAKLKNEKEKRKQQKPSSSQQKSEK